jgi:hypothetical protein
LFARLDQISRLFVDDALAADWRSSFQQTAVPLTICGQEAGSRMQDAQSAGSR